MQKNEFIDVKKTYSRISNKVCKLQYTTTYTFLFKTTVFFTPINALFSLFCEQKYKGKLQKTNNLRIILYLMSKCTRIQQKIFHKLIFLITLL